MVLRIPGHWRRAWTPLAFVCAVCYLLLSSITPHPRFLCDLTVREETQTQTILPLTEVIFSRQCQCLRTQTLTSPGQSAEKEGAIKMSENTSRSGGNTLQQHPYVFKTLLQPEVVTADDKTFVFCYVHSAAGNRHLRDRIRKSWGRSQNYPWAGRTVRSVFILGKPGVNSDQNLMADIAKESRQHGDIVMADFIDHYDNVTHKARTGLKYTAENYANKADLILKADDDMFINIFRVLGLLEQYGGCLFKGTNRRILCRTWTTGPHRKESGDKFYVSREEYPDDTYPNFCAGATYILAPDVVRDLYDVSLRMQFFRFDDVYVTGILREKIGAKLVSATQQYRLFDLTISPNNEVLEQFNFLHRLSDAKYQYLWSIHREASNSGKLIDGIL